MESPSLRPNHEQNLGVGGINPNKIYDFLKFNIESYGNNYVLDLCLKINGPINFVQITRIGPLTALNKMA
jgi:hypothetical protein